MVYFDFIKFRSIGVRKLYFSHPNGPFPFFFFSAKNEIFALLDVGASQQNKIAAVLFFVENLGGLGAA